MPSLDSAFPSTPSNPETKSYQLKLYQVEIPSLSILLNTTTDPTEEGPSFSLVFENINTTVRRSDELISTLVRSTSVTVSEVSSPAPIQLVSIVNPKNLSHGVEVLVAEGQEPVRSG